MSTQPSSGSPTADIGGGGAGLQALLGVLKAFGGIVGIGTVFMLLTGQTYSDDILNRFGISSVLVDRPVQMKALLGVQVLLQWLKDQAAAAGPIVSVAVLIGIVLVFGFLIARLPMVFAGAVIIVAGAGAFWMAPVIGDVEAEAYLAELVPLVAACRNNANACTIYQTAQGGDFKGVLITADSSKLFLATPTGLAQLPLTLLSTIILPSALGPQAPVHVASTTTPAATPTSAPSSNDGTPGAIDFVPSGAKPIQTSTGTGQGMPTQVAPMPDRPMPDIIFPRRIPTLPMPAEPVPGGPLTNGLSRPAPDFMPKGALVRHY